MKLYISPGSCSLSPHIALREAGLDFELVRVNTREHTTEDGRDYYKINELGYVPALEIHPGEVLREGPAIIQYIADLAPDSGLAPANGTLPRYRLQEWLSFLTTEIHKGFLPLFYPGKCGEYFAMTQAKMAHRFSWIDRQLAKTPYLMGEKFTIADGYLFALIHWGKASWFTSVYHLEVDLTEMKHLENWYKKVLARPAVLAAVAAEGLTLS
ncbi:glutathione transferase GstA [Ewingella sp. S1.OA.A_B6]